MARKSLTLVSVGPVTTRSPSVRRTGKHRCRRAALRRIEPGRCGPCQAVGKHHGAGIVLRSINAVGIAGDRRHPCPTQAPWRVPARIRRCDRRGPCPTVTVVSPPDRITVPGGAVRAMRGLIARHLPALAFDPVAEIDRPRTRHCAPPGSGSERRGRSRDDLCLGPCEARIAGLRRLACRVGKPGRDPRPAAQFHTRAICAERILAGSSDRRPSAPRRRARDHRRVCRRRSATPPWPDVPRPQAGRP